MNQKLRNLKLRSFFAPIIQEPDKQVSTFSPIFGGLIDKCQKLAPQRRKELAVFDNLPLFSIRNL